MDNIALTDADKEFVSINPEPPDLRDRNLQVPINRNPPPPPGAKIKRRRKEWVYKTQYDSLQKKYNILSWITWAGWIGFIITLKFVI